MKESMEQLGKRIGTLIKKSDNSMISAAVYAKEAHDRYWAGETDGFYTWKEWWEARTGLSRRRGTQLIRIGGAKDPEKALEEDRARNAAYKGSFLKREGPLAWSHRAKLVARIAEYAPKETCPKTWKMLKEVNEAIEAWAKIREHIIKGEIK